MQIRHELNRNYNIFNFCLGQGYKCDTYRIKLLKTKGLPVFQCQLKTL